MPLDQLTGLLARWHATEGRVARVGILREAADTLRGLSETERRALGGALAEQGMERLATPLVVGRDLGGDAGHALADDLLALDTDRVLDVLSSLEERAAHLPPPATDDAVGPWPPPPPAPAAEPAPPTMVEIRPGRTPGPADQPRPEAVEPAALDLEVPAAEETGAAVVAESAEPPGSAPEPRVDPGDRVLMPTTGRGDPHTVGATGSAEPDRAEGAMALLREVPAGWRRRRTADRLVQRGALDGVDPADLLGLFDRVGDRTLLAGRLLDRGGIDARTIGALLPPGPRRRLLARLARRG
jgi:hypothetical protein